VHVAEAQGFWKEQGLDVKQIYAPGIAATNVVLAGSVPMGHNTGGTVVRANARGGDLVALANTVEAPMTEIVLRKDVAERLKLSMKDPVADRAKAMKGLTIAINSPNTIIHGYLSYAAKKGGLDPAKDLVITPIEATAMVAALRNKQIDGFTFASPYTSTAIREGLAVKWISSVDGDFPELVPFGYNLTIAKKGFCPANEATCRKFMAGLNKALTFMHEHRPETLAILRKHFDKMAPEIVEASFNDLMKATPRVGKVDIRAMQNAQAFSLAVGLLRQDEIVSDFSGYIDNRYVAPK
jgi:ABC-type nitrate/sulfonate/bicarbonate transport system substrate-binding protein